MKKEYLNIANMVDEVITDMIINEGIVDFHFYDFAKCYFQRHKDKEHKGAGNQMLDVIDEMISNNPKEKQHLQPIVESKPLKIKDLKNYGTRETKSFFICEKMNFGKRMDRYIAKKSTITNDEFVFKLIDELRLYTDPINIQRQYFVFLKTGTRAALNFTDKNSENNVTFVDSIICMNYDEYKRE